MKTNKYTYLTIKDIGLKIRVSAVQFCPDPPQIKGIVKKLAIPFFYFWPKKHQSADKCRRICLIFRQFAILAVSLSLLTSCTITREGCRSQVLADVAIAVENHRDYRIAVYLIEYPFIYGAHAQLQIKDGNQWKWMDVGGLETLNCEPEHEIKKGSAIWLMTLDEYLKFLWDYERLHAGLDGDYYRAKGR